MERTIHDLENAVSDNPFLKAIFERIEDYAVDVEPLLGHTGYGKETKSYLWGFEVLSGDVCGGSGIRRTVIFKKDYKLNLWDICIFRSRDTTTTESFKTTKENSLKLLELMTNIMWDYHYPCEAGPYMTRKDY